MLVRLPEDGGQLPKHVAVDWYRVYVFVCASWSYQMDKVGRFIEYSNGTDGQTGKQHHNTTIL